jgi:single-strand DNA-binding protein
VAGLNKLIVMGNLGTDPDMRYMPNGNAVTDFRLAVNRRYTPSGGGDPVEETEWFTVTSWNRQAETVNQFLTKGQRVLVEGRFRSRTWTTNEGQPRCSHEILADRVVFLDRPGSGDEGQGQYQPAGAYAGDERQGRAPASDVEDLPW